MIKHVKTSVYMNQFSLNTQITLVWSSGIKGLTNINIRAQIYTQHPQKGLNMEKAN